MVFPQPELTGTPTSIQSKLWALRTCWGQTPAKPSALKPSRGQAPCNFDAYKTQKMKCFASLIK